MTFVIGKLYWVRFLDHSVGTEEKIVCEAVGWAIKEEKDHVTLSYWIVDTEDEQVKKDNIEPVCLIKSCIIRKRQVNIGHGSKN